jgi:hypothetical protein
VRARRAAFQWAPIVCATRENERELTLGVGLVAPLDQADRVLGEGLELVHHVRHGCCFFRVEGVGTRPQKENEKRFYVK